MSVSTYERDLFRWNSRKNGRRFVRWQARRTIDRQAQPPAEHQCWLLGEPGEEASRRAYRRRYKAETAMSLVKRRRGKAPTARIEISQRVQPLLRGVADNRLVRLGSSP